MELLMPGNRIIARPPLQLWLRSPEEWYIYSFPAQQCEVAKTSPKEFYDALDADGDGPTLDRVNGPNGGLAQVSIQYPVEGNPDMVNLVQFFTSDGFCEAYRRQQIHQNDDLK
jgi:hypothetical protein